VRKSRKLLISQPDEILARHRRENDRPGNVGIDEIRRAAGDVVYDTELNGVRTEAGEVRVGFKGVHRGDYGGLG
jgi:hypothetical protein